LNFYRWRIEFPNETCKKIIVSIFDYEGHDPWHTRQISTNRKGRVRIGALDSLDYSGLVIGSKLKFVQYNWDHHYRVSLYFRIQLNFIVKYDLLKLTKNDQIPDCFDHEIQIANLAREKNVSKFSKFYWFPSYYIYLFLNTNLHNTTVIKSLTPLSLTQCRHLWTITFKQWRTFPETQIF